MQWKRLGIYYLPFFLNCCMLGNVRASQNSWWSDQIEGDAGGRTVNRQRSCEQSDHQAFSSPPAQVQRQPVSSYRAEVLCLIIWNREWEWKYGSGVAYNGGETTSTGEWEKGKNTVYLDDLESWDQTIIAIDVLPPLQVLLKKMFGPDANDQGLADMLHKIESLFQQR